MLQIKFLVWQTWSWKTELFKDINDGLIIDGSNIQKENLEELVSLFKQVLETWKDEEDNYAKHILIDETQLIYNNEDFKTLFKELLDLFKQSKKTYYVTFSCFGSAEIDIIKERFDLD